MMTIPHILTHHGGGDFLALRLNLNQFESVHIDGEGGLVHNLVPRPRHGPMSACKMYLTQQLHVNTVLLN